MKLVNINNVNVVAQNVEDTPRSAIYLYFATNEKIPFSGAHILLGNLLLQGTDKKTAEDIASELEELGIEVSIDSRSDFLKVSIVCLNEDVEKALDIVNDFMSNSTFSTFDKEVFKFKGETISSLDSPSAKASDAFFRELFKDHKYGITSTKVLETIDELKVSHVIEYYKNLLAGKKLVSIASNIEDESAFLDMVSRKLSIMQNGQDIEIKQEPANQNDSKLVKIVKEDAKQAQIFQGWIVDGIGSEDCAKLTVLNNILGASGLSSRLFTELRDKQGLAYTVRSSYKTLKNAAYFMLYIGTEPSNIKKSLDGFKSEIQRIIDEPPTAEELQGAIENFIGKFKYFYTQTNAQIASANGWNWISGLDFDYNEQLLEKIKQVSVEDVVAMAKKYLQKDAVTVVLAPSKFLEF